MDDQVCMLFSLNWVRCWPVADTVLNWTINVAHFSVWTSAFTHLRSGYFALSIKTRTSLPFLYPDLDIRLANARAAVAPALSTLALWNAQGDGARIHSLAHLA